MADKVKMLRPVSGSTSTSPDMPQKQVIADYTTLSNATGLAVDRSQNVYVSDYARHVVLKYRLGTNDSPQVIAGAYDQAGLVDGQGTTARFTNPGAIAIDPSGVVYVVDVGNSRIRRISENGVVTTLAATTAVAGDPIAVDNSGNIFIVES